MTASDGEEWQVLVTTTDKKTARAYILSTATDIAAVRRRWEEDIGAAPDSQVLRSAAGERLDEALTLVEVGETFPSSQLVKLEAEGYVAVSVRVFEEPGASHGLSVFPSDHPETLFPTVRHLFNIPEPRVLRLLHADPDTGDRVLACGRPLSAQGVSRGALLLVDVAVEVTAKDMWRLEKERHLLFASETWAALLPLPKSHRQRVVYRERQVDVDRSVAASLRPFSLLSLACVDVELHLAREVTVADGSRARSRLVWPTDRPGDIAASPLSLDGVPLSPESKLADTGLREFAVVQVDARPVWVLLGDGGCHCVSVSSAATVGDLHAAVSAREGDAEFELRRGSLRLCDHDVLLQDLALSVDAPLRLERRAVWLSVEVDGQTVAWSTGRRSLRFSDVRDELVARTGIGHRELTEMTLACAGCGRRMRQEDEQSQSVPVQCCDERSLRLVAVQKRDVGVQCSHLPVDAGRIERPTPTVEETGRQEVAMQDAAVNTSRVSIVPDERCRLFVWVENGKDQLLDEALPSPITVGDVRRAVASRLAVRSMRVQMERWTGRRPDGCACYQVCSDKGKFVGIGNTLAEFGTKAGDVISKLEAFNQILVKQYYDEEEFPLVPGRRSVLNVFVLSNPMAPARLYINNSEGQDFAISPLLAQPASVSEVRQATAREMRVNAACIRLERWTALGGPRGVACVQVCDRNGKFVNINDEEILEFGDAKGNIFRKSAVVGESLTLLTDDMPFVQVSSRRSILNLTQHHPRRQQCTLLVVQQSSPNFSFKTILDEPVTVGAVRGALSDAMNVDAASVRFERWVGTGPRGERCVQVGNVQGQLVGIGADDCEFGAVSGSVYRKGDLIERELCALTDDTAPFVLVKNRAIVVNAYQLDAPAVPVPIHVSNRKGEDFVVCPLLPRPCTVGDVRSLMAQQLRVKPGCVKLKQWLGMSPNDEPCAQVCAPDDHFISINRPEVEFGTPTGNLCLRGAVKNERLVELRCDSSHLVHVPGRRLVMNLSQRHPPAKKCPLYLWREDKNDLVFSPYLPRSPTVGDVRDAVALETKVPPSNVVIKRWVGFVGGEECVQVCSAADNFVSIGEETVEFGKADGAVLKKNKVSRLKKQTLTKNTDHFLFVSGRRNVINIE